MLTHLTDTVPEFQWAPEYDILPTEPTFGVRALFFRGCDYKGKRTRVFAYYGIPEHKPGERVPAILLVHGGIIGCGKRAGIIRRQREHTAGKRCKRCNHIGIILIRHHAGKQRNALPAEVMRNARSSSGNASAIVSRSLGT